jgi:hypothetical protein
MKKSSETIGNRTRDLPVCSAVPQPLRHRVPHNNNNNNNNNNNTILWNQQVRTDRTTPMYLTSYEQYCKPHGIPFGMKNLNMYYIFTLGYSILLCISKQ